MAGKKQESSARDTPGSPLAHGSALLADAILQVISWLEGRSSTSLMAEIMCISPQLARRQNGVPRRPRRIDHATAHAEVWLRGRLFKAGLTESEVQLLLAERPAGLVEGLLYWMFGGSPLATASYDAIRELETIDSQLFTLAVERDVCAMLKWLREEQNLRPHLFGFVDVAGCPSLTRTDLAPLEEMSVRLRHLTTNMLLSLLAVIDHEITPRVAGAQWRGCSLLAALLAPDDTPGVYSPIALMVDLVLAVSLASYDRAFPAERPQALDVERRIASLKPTASTTARTINSLRRREKKFDRRALRMLMLDTKLHPAGTSQTVAEEAEMLIPLLAGAHLLTALMPTPLGKKAHPNRRGWRVAYIRCWETQAVALGLPTAPAGNPGPPAWVMFA